MCLGGGLNRVYTGIILYRGIYFRTASRQEPVTGCTEDGRSLIRNMFTSKEVETFIKIEELVSYLLLFYLYSVSLFVEDEVEQFDPLKTVYDFIQFVDRICVVGLQVSDLTNGKDMKLMPSPKVGRFFQMTVGKQRFKRWLPPVSSTFQRLSFDGSIISLSIR